MLDIRTIVVLLLVSAVLMNVTLAIGIRSAGSRGLVKWNVGLGMVALAWLLIAGRDSLPPILGVAFADSVMMMALCTQLAALVEFANRKPPPWLPWAPGALLFAALLPVLENFVAVTVIGSLGIGGVLLALAAYASRLGKSGAGPARWMMTAVFLAGAFLLLLRAASIWIEPAAHTNVFTPSIIQSMAFVVFFAMTIAGSFAFLVMQEERMGAEIRHLALIDGLTDLFNRRAFLDLAGREQSRAKRSKSPFSFLMMDIDHFKQVNDVHGHQAGDRVLADFAAILKRCVRHADLAGRYGGEEFCALLPDTDLAHALVVAERIRAAVAREPLGGLPGTITVSIGAAEYAANSDTTLDLLIARADKALYRAKETGRDRVVALEA